MALSNEALINTTPCQNLSTNFNNSSSFDVRTIIPVLMAFTILGTIQILNQLKSNRLEETKIELGPIIIEKKAIKLGIIYILMIFNIISLFLWINVPDRFNGINYIPNFSLSMLLISVTLQIEMPILERQSNREKERYFNSFRPDSP